MESVMEHVRLFDFLEEDVGKILKIKGNLGKTFGFYKSHVLHTIHKYHLTTKTIADTNSTKLFGSNDIFRQLHFQVGWFSGEYQGEFWQTKNRHRLL